MGKIIRKKATSIPKGTTYTKRPPFVHLHTHCEKSFKDGLSFVSELIDRALEIGQTSLALTDHGVMFASLDFYLEAKKKGLNPIMGCEVYVKPEGFSAELPSSDDPDDEKNTDKKISYFHMILLAKDVDGLKNLHKIVSIANDCDVMLEGDDFDKTHIYYKPRVKFSDLEEYSEGLICTSACVGGEIPQLLIRGKDAEAKKVAKKYKALFGENFYLEIQGHELKAKTVLGKLEKLANEKIIKLAKELDIELVLTNDVHYAKKEEYEDHKLLKCISYKEDFSDAKNYDKYFPTPDFYMKSDDEMWEVAKAYGKDGEDAYYNAARIAEQCKVDIIMDLHFPKATLPKGYIDPNKYLSDIVDELTSVKYDDADDEEVIYRKKKELFDIRLGKFPDYFLNIRTLIDYCKENAMLIGAGRGSCAGSIVSNILNITDVDPIEFDLIWERFWHAGRSTFAYKGEVITIEEKHVDEEMVTVLLPSGKTKKVSPEDLVVVAFDPPDIDIDVPSNRREELFDFTKENYGYDHVASIVTTSTLKAASLINNGGVALGYSEDFIKKVKKCVPWGGSPTLEQALNSDELSKLYASDKEVKKFIDRISRVAGRSISSSSHPAGVVITDAPMWNYFPVSNGKNGMTSQYSQSALETIGCLKIDLLGHGAEEIADDAIMLIKDRHDVDINYYKIPNDDKKTFQLFKEVRMAGVPQLQSSWHIPIIQDVMGRDVNSLSIEDVIALVTMIRPGSMDSGQTKKYQDNCQGKDIKADVPELAPIVSKYKNCLLYQEQIMQVATDLGGFALDKADELRKVCAKTKYAHLAEKMLVALEKGLLENKVSKKSVVRILEIVTDFFKYSFNKAHAAGYGITTYRIAWFKANYFIEAMVALLNNCIGNVEKTNEYLREVRYMGFEVFPPNVNKSGQKWTCDDDGLYIPLSAIDGMGSNRVEAIIEERELKGEYTSFVDFVERTPGKSVNIGNIGNLILCGAFDCFDYNRLTLWESHEALVPVIRNGKKSGKLMGKKDTVIDVVEESNIETIKEDEVSTLGFNVTMTPKEKELLKKQLEKEFGNLCKNGSSQRNGRDDKNVSKGKSFDKKPDATSAKDKLKKRVAKVVKHVEESAEESGSKEDVKSKLRSKVMNKSQLKNRVALEVDSDEDISEQRLVVQISQDVNVQQLFLIMKKSGMLEGSSRLVLNVKMEDGNALDVITDKMVTIKAKDKVKLKKQFAINKFNLIEG